MEPCTKRPILVKAVEYNRLQVLHGTKGYQYRQAVKDSFHRMRSLPPFPMALPPSPAPIHNRLRTMLLSFKGIVRRQLDKYKVPPPRHYQHLSLVLSWAPLLRAQPLPLVIPPRILTPPTPSPTSFLIPHPLQRLQPLLLRLAVDPRPNHKANDIEKRHPRVLGQELLRERQRQRGRDPGHFHDGQEARADGGVDLVQGARAGDDGHGGEVDAVLDWGDLGRCVSIQRPRARLVACRGKGGGTYDQIADEDLCDLRLQARPPGEHLLQDADQ